MITTTRLRQADYTCPVPLEYSIAGLICAVACGLEVVMVG
jgi:hypothetical protein